MKVPTKKAKETKQRIPKIRIKKARSKKGKSLETSRTQIKVESPAQVVVMPETENPDDDDDIEFVIEKILNKKTSKRGSDQYLVQCKGFSTRDEDTFWVDEEGLGETREDRRRLTLAYDREKYIVSESI